jgi:hypothetical protein
MRVSLLGLAVAAALTLPGPHAAACSMPAVLADRVCTDPELAKLDAELVAREKAVQAATARPATWAARGAQFRAWLAADRGFDDKPFGREEIASHIRSQIDDLDKELGRAKGIKPARDAAAVLGEKCLAGWLYMNCKVPAAGIARDGALSILWQVQSGASDADGGGAGVMLWDASGTGAPRPIGWTFEGVEMRQPTLHAESGLLWVAGLMGGTGEANADILYQKRGDRWVEIEMTSWRAELDKRLPKGIGVWKGVKYNFLAAAMGADAELWKDSDANCCPTAGRANLGFVIEGDRLKLDTISAQLGGPAEAWKDY